MALSPANPGEFLDIAAIVVHTSSNRVAFTPGHADHGDLMSPASGPDPSPDYTEPGNSMEGPEMMTRTITRGIASRAAIALAMAAAIGTGRASAGPVTYEKETKSFRF